MFCFDQDADATTARPAPREATLAGAALLDALRVAKVAEGGDLGAVLRERAERAITLDAEGLDVARRLGARLDRSRAAYRAVIQRAQRERAAVVHWNDAEGAPCAVSLPRAVAWRVRDGLDAQGVRAGITFNCPQ